MKKATKQWGFLRIFTMRKFHQSQVESTPAETSAYSSNDLGERLKNLPIELRQKILCSFTLKERLQLRLVNKAMLDAVNASLSDVQEIGISFYSLNHSFVTMTTINPYNGAKKTHYYTPVPTSSLPYLLKWAGAQLKTLKLSTAGHEYKELHVHSRIKYRIFKASKSENTCKFLQDLLDQCHGLKELDMDNLLEQKDFPIVALRYPTTLIELKHYRIGKAPGDLSAIVSNCPNLQVAHLYAGLPDDAKVHTLASLSDLRDLTLTSHSTKEKIAQIISQSLAAFGDHPFGASIARPWPHLKSVTLECFKDKKSDTRCVGYHLLLSGANCCITSLRLTPFVSCSNTFYYEALQQLFKALNSENACPHLMELDIRVYDLSNYIKVSEAVRNDREEWARSQLRDLGIYAYIPRPNPALNGLLNDILAYVTKRQLAVRLGTPFLRSLSIRNCRDDVWNRGVDDFWRDFDILMKPIDCPLQQILDQCHGLEELYMESLNERWINPNAIKGRELMDIIMLRFPTTLKKLNYWKVGL